MNVKQISSGTEVLSELSLGTRPASTRFTLKELSSALHHGARLNRRPAPSVKPDLAAIFERAILCFQADDP